MAYTPRTDESDVLTTQLALAGLGVAFILAGLAVSWPAAIGLWVGGLVLWVAAFIVNRFKTRFGFLGFFLAGVLVASVTTFGIVKVCELASGVTASPSSPIPPQTSGNQMTLKGGILWTMSGDDSTHTAIYVIVAVENLGEPTTISGWGLRIKSGERVYLSDPVYIPEDHEVIVAGKTIATIHRKDTVDWAVVTPVEHNHVLQGWLRFRFDNVKLEDLLQPNARWFIKFHDINERVCVMWKIWTADEIAYTFKYREFKNGEVPKSIPGFPAGTEPPFPISK